MNALSTFVIVPMYIYPYPLSAWTPLLNSVAANPNVDFKVIVNPQSGPGAGMTPDYNYTINIAKLNSYSNVATLGYVYTSYGARAESDVEKDIRKYLNWDTVNGTYDVHMDGIFVDQAPNDGSYYDYLQGLSNLTKSTSTGNTFIINPGSMPDTSFYDFSDYVNVFESTLANYNALDYVNSVVPTYVYSQSSAIIYDYDDPNDLAWYVSSLVSNGFGGFLLTSGNGWFNSWPANWGDFMTALGGAVGSTEAAIVNIQGNFKRPTHKGTTASSSVSSTASSSALSSSAAGFVTSTKALPSSKAASSSSVVAAALKSSSSTLAKPSSAPASSSLPVSSVKPSSSSAVVSSSAKPLTSAKSSSSSSSAKASAAAAASSSANIAARDL